MTLFKLKTDSSKSSFNIFEELDSASASSRKGRSKACRLALNAVITDPISASKPVLQMIHLPASHEKVSFFLWLWNQQASTWMSNERVQTFSISARATVLNNSDFKLEWTWISMKLIGIFLKYPLSSRVNIAIGNMACKVWTLCRARADLNSSSSLLAVLFRWKWTIPAASSEQRDRRRSIQVENSIIKKKKRNICNGRQKWRKFNHKYFRHK